MQEDYVELETVRDLLYPRIWTWRDLFLEAFYSIRQQDPAFLRPLSSATVAGLVCDHAYSLISNNIHADPRVTLKLYHGQKHFWVDDLICLRIKKVNRNFLSSNYRTKQSREWNAQSPLPGLDLGARIELGYQVDITGSVLLGIYVLYRLHKTVQWLWQIHGEQVSTFGSQPSLTNINSIHQRHFLYEPDPK